MNVTMGNNGRLTADIDPVDGQLMVQKTVDDGDTNAGPFTFTIILQGSGIAEGTQINYVGGTIANVTAPMNGSIQLDANGQAIFQLSHGQTITFLNLPYGTNYTVSEQPTSGYTSTVSNGAGMIQEGTTTTVSFVNTKTTQPSVTPTPTPQPTQQPTTNVTTSTSTWTPSPTASEMVYQFVNTNDR